MAFYIILLLLRARVCYFICMCYFCSYEMVIMKNLFRTVSVIALAGWFLACSERKSEACYEIIPAPLEIRENFSGGEFVFSIFFFNQDFFSAVHQMIVVFFY